MIAILVKAEYDSFKPNCGISSRHEIKVLPISLGQLIYSEVHKWRSWSLKKLNCYCTAIYCWLVTGKQTPPGGFALKKEMLDSRRFPKMHLNLQRLLQVVAHGEQVFPRVKEKCATKEQINRKLYYLSILSVIFLPLSIITGIFGHGKQTQLLKMDSAMFNLSVL
ncbi:hypothetical protein AAC387_Pa03g2044 [Persea americana]